jgi:hypothetical protein
VLEGQLFVVAPFDVFTLFLICSRYIGAYLLAALKRGAAVRGGALSCSFVSKFSAQRMFDLFSISL